MTQAVLILAHKDFDQVLELARQLKSKFDIYIHFDVKMNLSSKEKKKLKNEGIKYISNFDIKWGSWSIVKATIDLMEYALKDKSIDYFHLISGQDWPVGRISDIYEYFEKNKMNIYIDSEDAYDVRKSGEPIIWWMKYYFPYDRLNRRSLFGKVFHRVNILFQTMIGINKLKKLDVDFKIYSGSQWFDLPRYAIEYALEYLNENKELKKVLSTSFCSDEFWIPTILRNNKDFTKNIVKNNHRFIKWEKKNGSYPAILDEDDYEDIIFTDAFFARKIDSNGYSKKLVKKLIKN